MPQAVRWALVAAIGLGAVAAVVLSPTPVTTEHLVADLRDGKVERLQNPCYLQPAARWTQGVRVTADSDDRPSLATVCWVNESGRAYSSAIRREDLATRGRQQNPRLARALAATAAEPYEADREIASIRVGEGAHLMLSLGVLLLVVMLLVGPQPHRFTRWGTFWLILLPYGVGALYWLVRDGAWAQRSDATAGPEPGETGELRTGTRHSGGRAFVILLLTSVLAAAVSEGLIDALTAPPDLADPRIGPETQRG